MVKFYERDGKCFVNFDGEEIILGRELFRVYSKLYRDEGKNDRTYYRHNCSFEREFSLDDGIENGNLFSYVDSLRKDTMEDKIIEKEVAEEIFKGLNNDTERMVAYKRVKGFYNYEIAEEMGISKRTIARINKNIKDGFKGKNGK